MNPTLQKILLTKPIIPVNLRPNVLAWWDSRDPGRFIYDGTNYYWRDMSGNGRNLTLSNFAWSGASGWQQPYGLKGDATDDWIGRTESGLISANTSFSISTWVAPSTANAGMRNMYGFKTDFTTDPAFYLYYDTGNFTFSAIDSITGNHSVAYTMSTAANRPYHVVATYNQADKKSRMYINGVLVATSATALTNGICACNYIRSMRSLAGTAYVAQRNCCDSLFNKALSPGEVQQLYNANKRRFAT